MSLRPLRTAVDGWRPMLARPGDPLSAIAAAWPDIAGSRAAQHSAPLEISGDALVVATRSSAWSQQLQLLAPQILERLREFDSGGKLVALRFRSGLPRRLRSVRAPVPQPAFRAPGTIPPDPALDEIEALDRLRRRVGVARRRAAATCERCGAPIERGDVCAPCRSAAESARSTELERMLFSMPWLPFKEIRTFVGGIDEERYERVRRNLLQRWWATLERARRTGRSLTRRERQIATSYVLLQSGLAPDRITPAIVRNLLGDELAAQLSGATAAN
jgi:hypothetical protein